MIVSAFCVRQSTGDNLVQIGSDAKRVLARRRRNPVERNTLPPMLKIA